MKLKTLQAIMEKICGDKNLQVGRDAVLIKNPARVCFAFNEEECFLINSQYMSVEEVSKLAKDYGLQRDKSEPKTFQDYSVGYRFKLNKEYKK
ncbi:MAG: hypothetical protein AABW67_03980 [Nanoarchaeota archaeon]